MKKITSSAILILLSAACFALPDSNYVRRFSTRFYIKTFVKTTGFNYSIKSNKSNFFSSEELKDSKVKYLTYTPVSAGFAINLFSVGFSHTFQSSVAYLNTTNKIATYFRGYTLNYYGRVFSFENFFEFDKRFYYSSGRESATYLIAPENSPYSPFAKCYNAGTNIQVVFNSEKFSYKAAFSQSEFQKKPAGSFLFMLQSHIIHFEDDSSGLIPSPRRVFYDSTASLRMNRQTSFIFSPGYAYNFAYKNFYAAAAVYGGLGPQVQRTATSLDKFRQAGIAFYSKVKFSMGFNAKKVYGGIFANFDWNHSDVNAFGNSQFYDEAGVFIAFRIIKEKNS